MEAVVLAGGLGTRLAGVVKDVPKPMAPVNNRPFLCYLLDYLSSQKIRRVVLAVGYKADCIRQYFGNSYKGMDIEYSFEDSPLGTGGAIRKALGLCKDETVFVLNGDTYFEVDFGKLICFHNEHGGDMTIAVKYLEDTGRYGTIVANNGRIVKFSEKTGAKGVINGGVYLMGKSLLDGVVKNAFSFETDFCEANVDTLSFYCLESSGFFIDIGLPEDYNRIRKDYRFGARRALFLDRDGTINKDKHYLHKRVDLELIPGVAELIKSYNDKGYLVLVITNQAGIARGLYSERDMHLLHKHLNEILSQYGAHIDRFYFCPHHPDYTGVCDCRKPAVGMIKQADEDYNIDFQNSILIGDKPWDIECGEKMGIPSVYVQNVLIALYRGNKEDEK